MSHETRIPEGEEPWWLDHPDNRRWVFRGVVALYAVFLVAGLLPYEHHPYFPFEQLGFFGAVYGLVCCIGLVLGAAWMRTWLMRDEDYYDAE